MPDGMFSDSEPFLFVLTNFPMGNGRLQLTLSRKVGLLQPDQRTGKTTKGNEH